MSILNHFDIAAELKELCREISNSVKMQLTYYKASVYKHETADQIQKQIDQMKTVVELFSDQMMLEPFKDFEATAENGNVAPQGGECLFSSRVLTLLRDIEQSLAEFGETTQGASQSNNRTKLTKNVLKSRQKLLAICRHGTRQWDFFQTL